METKPLLQIQFNFKNLLLFLVFFLFLHELHELAHIITGRVICGCWGTRDFNVWDICTDCIKAHPIAILSVFAGPVFTFIMLWVGRYLIRHGSSSGRRSLGLFFVLGNMQFGRMYMAAMNSGDEVSGLRSLFLAPDHSNALLIRIVTVIIVSAICLPPMITAYRAIANKNRILVYAGFLVIPLILDTVILLVFLNGILQKGVLNQVWIMGTPLLITLWFIVCTLILAVNLKGLTRFGRQLI